MLFVLLLVPMANIAYAVSEGGHTITYDGREYDGVNDQTKFTYTVTSGSQPALSHWVMALSECFFDANDVVEASESWEWVSPDPKTGLTGIKFDTGYEGGESRTVWFKLSGDIAEGDVQVGTKAGKNVEYDTITGPVGGADWDSYKEGYTGPICNLFADYATEHIVYMCGTGFKEGTYNVVYWDGDGIKVQTESIPVGVDGILESQHTFQMTDVVGIWYASVYLGATPATHDDKTNLCADDTFKVAMSAIPEFTTVLAGIVVAGMCGGIYWWMWRRQLAVSS